MTLSGVSSSERKERAKQALADVGLSDHINKKPNQLSGGQMQRVAIARALVNNPDIILADEPTGALDSKTSTQVMDILRQIAKERLVIMVTHNEEIANQYSSRIIRFLDGQIQSDSDPIVDQQADSDHQPRKSKKRNKTSMSLFTALSLSFKNLLTKKGRTILTAFAGSIGIIGVALVLALSSGLSNQLDVMQGDTLANFPIMIDTNEQFVDFTEMGPPGSQGTTSNYEEFPDDTTIYSFDVMDSFVMHKNILTDEFLDYVAKIEEELPDQVNNIAYSRGVGVNLLTEGTDGVVKFETSLQDQAMPGFSESAMGLNHWHEMPEDQDFILELYDLIGEDSRLPEAENEIAIVVDQYNRLSTQFLDKLALTDDEYDATDFIGKTMLKVLSNDVYYTETEDGLFIPAAPADYQKLYNEADGLELVVTGILRVKEEAATSYFSEGFIYTSDLTDRIIADAQQSVIAQAQEDSDINLLTNTPFQAEEIKEYALIYLGATTTPVGVDIYPTDFEGKDAIKDYLDEFNLCRDEEDQIVYNDLAEMVSDIMTDMINTVTYVLVGFAAISLIVSTIMIGIITYVSVIERTKEIGILRSVGARKKDISRVFNAETMIIGFVSGSLGILISYLLIIPINNLIYHLTDIEGVANLNVTAATILIVGSMILTLIAGVIPSRMAAKKDPVVALRTE
ncbi:ABC transporter ATP-binding protein/permease [Amphibacillus indicireducens]|uniref:ABC transporter ATP-binding protein/permease n=2 Tax=Amphibacillus indicireducens TaxID=1076330 RepID=A0ABP7V318_9BACI